MRKIAMGALCAVFVVAGCGGAEDVPRPAALESSTTTTRKCPPGQLMGDSGCESYEPYRPSSTTIPPEQAAFEAEFAKMPEEMRRNFTGQTSGAVADQICTDSAELTFVGLIGVEHYPDVARAGFVWKCPDRVQEHDNAVLRAIAEDARRRAAPPSTQPAPAPQSGETVSQENARESGASYLKYGAFSRSGLIDQLVYEGFSQADATYAVDALNPDWNQQAAKSAASYLKYGAFSRSGLIDQLLYEGFTQSQAEYGVSTTGL